MSQTKRSSECFRPIADVREISDTAVLLRRIAFLLVLSATLSSCSYAYDLLAIARDGRLVLIVDPASSERPSCLREIEVTAERPATVRAQAEAGDDVMRVGYATFWFEAVSYDDDCANRFPLRYGTTLNGSHLTDWSIVKAKPLLREVVYDVHATTGATGYGGGRFIIHTNGHIENLPRQGGPDNTTNLIENAD